jgi:hypothetical protein
MITIDFQSLKTDTSFGGSENGSETDGDYGLASSGADTTSNRVATSPLRSEDVTVTASPLYQSAAATQSGSLFPVFDQGSFSSFYSSGGLRSLSIPTVTPSSASQQNTTQDGDDLEDKKPVENRRKQCKRRLQMTPETVKRSAKTSPVSETSRPDVTTLTHGSVLHVPKVVRPHHSVIEHLNGPPPPQHPQMTSRYPLLPTPTPTISEQAMGVGRYGNSPLAAATAMAYLQATGYDVLTAADIGRWVFAAGQLQSKLDEYSGDCWMTSLVDNRSQDLVADVQQPLDLSPLVKRIAVKQIF